jgi:hypothetical protein
MRASNGVSLPAAASTERLPATSAAANTSSAANRPVRASAVYTCVPFSSASPSLGASLIGFSFSFFSALAAGTRTP